MLFVFRTDTRIGQRGAISPPFPTQAEVAADASLYSPAMYLRRSDILLAVIIYKTVETDQEITYYARVVQSLRGDIPVEALIQWSWAAHKHSAVSFSKPEPGSSPKTELYSGNYMYYTLASSKEVKNCRTRRNLLLRRTVSRAWIPMIWETTSFTSR